MCRIRDSADAESHNPGDMRTELQAGWYSAFSCICMRISAQTPIVSAFRLEATLKEVRDRYREAVGYEMQPFVERMVMDYIGRGMEIEVVEHAIEVTGWALRPSAHYLRAILRRYEEQNIWTMTAVRWDEVKRSNEQDLFRRTQTNIL